jgi:Tfp pilus assembly protein PilN
MRPVNLIPTDERRGDSAPLRTGSLVYVVLAGLALLLLGIVAVALTSKQISDRKSEKAAAEQELTVATARATSVQAFTNFRTVQENRAATVASLAQSRFDWPRVLHELALVLPSDVEISSLTGTVSPDVQVDSTGGGAASGSNLRAGVEGPALEIVGCAPSQDAVAGFVAALEDIDGVTRVGVDSSKLPDENTSQFSGEPGNGTTTGTSGSSDCQAGPTIAKFTIVAAFDAVPTPAAATAAPSVPSTPATASDQVADAQSQAAVAKASDQATTSRAQSAAASLPGGG